MRQNINLYIPEPCYEDWNKMTTTQQGRYCQSCCKQVVDFTNMNDQQIIDYLSNTKEKTCGRFDHDQLHRPLQKTKHRYWKWIIASFTLLFFFFNKVNAQRKQQCDNKNKVKKDKNNSRQVMGVVPPNIAADTSKIKIIGQLVAPKKDVIEDKRKKKK